MFKFNSKALVHVLAAAALASAAGVVMAAGTDASNVSVGATLTSACEVTETASIQFGSIISLESTGDRVANSLSSFQVACSSGASPVIYSSTERIMTDGASANLPFSLSLDEGGTTELPLVAGNALPVDITKDGTMQNVTLYAKVLATNFAALPAGNYTKTVAVAVNY